MKHVYFFNHWKSSQVNGIGTYLGELLKCIDNMENAEVTVLDFDTTEPEFSIVKDDNDHRRMVFPKITGNYFPKDYKVIDKFMRLHIDDVEGNIFILNNTPCYELIHAIKTSFPKSKLYFVIHDHGWTATFLSDREMFRKTIENRHTGKGRLNKFKDYFPSFDEQCNMYTEADGVIALCRSTSEILKEIYKVPANKIHLIPNGLTDTIRLLPPEEKLALRKKLFFDENEKLMVFAGRANWTKGTLVLFKAFEKILETHPEARLIVVGPIYNFAEQFIFNSDFWAKVTFTGKIKREQLYNLYQIADVGLMPSYYEQSPYVGMEMMMHGLPVVCSDGIGLGSDMFFHNYNAVVAKLGNRKNPEAFTSNLIKAVDRILSSEKLRVELSRNTLEAFKEKFAWEVMFENYKTLIANS